MKNQYFNPVNGSVIWITGLCDSGKTTLANNLANKLRNKGILPIILDPSDMKQVYGYHDNERDRDSRLKWAFISSRLCKHLAVQGYVVIRPTISLLKEILEWNRKNLPGYFEIFINTPIEVLKDRDTKGIYRKYAEGEVSNVYGLDFQADIPSNPDYIVEYNADKTAIDVAEEVFQYLTKGN